VRERERERASERKRVCEREREREERCFLRSSRAQEIKPNNLHLTLVGEDYKAVYVSWN